jgi:hypothetical protein
MDSEVEDRAIRVNRVSFEWPGYEQQGVSDLITSAKGI